MTHQTSVCPSLTSNKHRANVRGATPPPQKRLKERHKEARKPEPPNHRATRRKQTNKTNLLGPPSGRHPSANRKNARIAWCQPLTHHARRDSRENQLLLPPAEESATSHVSTFRSASDKAKVGLQSFAVHCSWRTFSTRSMFVA